MMRFSLTQKQTIVLLLLIFALAAALMAGILSRQINLITRGIFDLTDPVVTNPKHNRPELGLVVALEQYNSGELEDNLHRIELLGIKKIRQTYFYAPDFDWTSADQHFSAIKQFPSLEIVPLLDGNPADNFSPIPPEEFAAWAAEFAQRYKTEINEYIIWDEPNITTHWGNKEINPQGYAAILSAASATIRSNDPTAQIILAPLAPTTENNLINMTEGRYLQELYGAGVADSFDIVAIKPYGFELPPTSQTISPDVLNFSRPVLVREVMLKNGDGHKAIWAGNWGWNSLPPDWNGLESPWETVLNTDLADYTQNGFERAQSEWPWMGTMFVHHWDPILTDGADPAVGFSLSRQNDLSWLKTMAESQEKAFAQSGFYPASQNLSAANWLGNWRFSPEFGADMSEKSDGDAPDQVVFHFEGTSIGLQVRRANYRARFNILIDGEPANALPSDERTADYGSALVLNTNSLDEDQIETIPVATGLPAGQHEMVVTGFRGWEQWALKGFVVANRPDTRQLEIARFGLIGLALVFSLAAAVLFRSAELELLVSQIVPRSLSGLGYLWLTSVAAIIVSLTGWLTWGATADGIFRRLGDGSQLVVLFGTAIVFYVTPWLPVYLLALVFLFILIYQRPVLGLILITFSIPFYVPQLLKPIYQYRFSPVETFTLVTFGAVALKASWLRLADLATKSRYDRNNTKLSVADIGVLLLGAIACVSLAFTERLGVATNELRTVIIGPTLFYWMLRQNKPTVREIRWLLIAFVSGGLLVALIGLGQYFTGDNLIIAEDGLQRLRSIYGSPNNVALYLGRIFPLLLAFLLTAGLKDGFRLSTLKSVWKIALALLVILAAILLSFSRGGILLGLPLSAGAVLVLFQKRRNRPVWPWLTAGVTAVILGYFAALQVPSLAGRLTLSGQTAGFRINLWRSSLQIIQDHPLTGVGLDNFLYAYRNRYILAQAWQEPNLNHPHNHIFDFSTRLGLPGLLAGVVIFWGAFKNIFSTLKRNSDLGHWGLLTGLTGSLIYILGHGLVDHSFFLVDLAYSTYFILAISGLDFEGLIGKITIS
ncbi:MAG: O-antigen ligase [Cellvibrionaceae bacterium]|jgi:O-antigen ligase